ncbi:C39 family peptidase [Plantactinospora sp. S1510]|uniref:C39 family peptidase n=1 Tax=Plantactinospora alkalitolerans TaxID=2789879 RepID=A0ABS0GVF2_9ACTN|nr:C39 family peptidase [Plantactinospora alkalitolerans]MBF9130175.1 C39 family peptidase [Plantactinospora alkalitolerans]
MARPPFPTSRRAFVFAGITTLALLGTAAPAGATVPQTGKRPVSHDEQITYQDWSSYADWRGGSHQGTVAIPGVRTGITMLRPFGTTEYADPHTGITKTWAYSTWTSPVTSVGFDASELVASWNADTPAGTWIQIELQGTYNTGNQTPWYVMGRWASGDQDIRRTTVNRQGDPWSTIWTDTFSIDDVANGVMLRAYQLRLTLYRAPDARHAPRVRMLGAMSSMVPDRFSVPPSAGRIAWGRELRVPTYSQNVHAGHYPEYDGGGQAWCSPTSTEMVVEYWGQKPSAEDTSWVNPDYPDHTVNHAARMVYDYAYEGAGNWPFNTAYAASFPGLDAKVTRLHSLDEVEHFIKAGIPVVTSQSFLAEELDGANYGTSGHLFVVVGFTRDGDVIINDPASSSNDVVRNVYQREQFEQIWLRTKRTNASGGVSSGSGGIAYLIKPWWKPWPKLPGSTNW